MDNLPSTPAELAAQICERIKTNGGGVSSLREHAVHAQLHSILRLCGYRAAALDPKQPVALQLANQVCGALEEIKKVAPGISPSVLAHLQSVLSNVTADGGVKTAPPLKVAPTAPVRAKSSANLAAVALLLIGFTAMTFGFPAAAQESFNITNYILNGATLVGSPTNQPVAVTNLIDGVAGTNYTGNGVGRAITVRNYDNVGFGFHGIISSTTAGDLIIKFGRAQVGNPPVAGTPITLGTNTIYSGVTATDFETTPQWTVDIPYGAQTNYINWQTNLDRTIIGPASHIGILLITNSGPSGAFVTNAWAGLYKKVIPRSITGGNF